MVVKNIDAEINNINTSHSNTIIYYSHCVLYTVFNKNFLI